MGYPDSNTFRGLRVVNMRRCVESFHPIESWSACDWMTAVAGEVGEAANLIKKLKRIETDGLDTPQNRELILLVPQHEFAAMSRSQQEEAVKAAVVKKVGDELADVVIYLDLLAARLGIDLGEAVIRKFNATSEKIGSTERLPY